LWESHEPEAERAAWEMTSSNFMASRVGKRMPVDFRKTGQRFVCGECGAIFSVIGPRVLINMGVTDKQIEHMEIVIAGEHVDDKFSDHLESYDFG
jgi:hypothetical protein